MVSHLLMLIAMLSFLLDTMSVPVITVMARSTLLSKIVSVSGRKLDTAKHPKSSQEVAIGVIERNVVTYEGDISYSRVTPSLHSFILDAAPCTTYNR
jgi:hypothetical protein